MKKLMILALAMGVLSMPTIAHAETDVESGTEASSVVGKKGGKHKERMEMLKSMSEEERKAYFAEKKAKWDAMSDEEKAAKRAEMEQKKAERKAKFEEKYATLTDEQKAKVDAKREKRKAFKEKIRAERESFKVNQ